MDIPKKNIELENHAKCELLKANLSSTFSYRRAFLLGRQDALKNIESSSRIVDRYPSECVHQYNDGWYITFYDYGQNKLIKSRGPYKTKAMAEPDRMVLNDLYNQ